ncbi:SH3 domain-containing protein [Chryseobacterium rhizosphaerae]|uniref:SH3 domain-containing protein n=1 Tax=Chryseobacterium rhizosphaerae TaxID=395937 RepID=UPI003D09F5BE
MKTFVSILLSCLLGFVSDSFSSSKPEKNDYNARRCTGSSTCTACSNCSGCAHCKSGGMCGVCKGNFSGKSKPSVSSKREETKNNPRKAPKVFIEDNDLNFNSNKTIIATRSVSIFEKPSFHSKVIETVSKKIPLITLSKNGSWYKVKVQKSGKTGYVNSSHIQ